MTPTVVVHPMDSLAAAGTGLAHAIAIACCHGAALHVVHVRPASGRSAAEAGIADRLAERLHDVVAAMAPRPPRVIAAVLDGHPVHALGSYARETSADLIVIERRRRPGRYWSGRGSAAAIGRAAGCPVLAVPSAGRAARRPPDGSFRHVVSAVNFSDASARALHRALTIVQHSGGRITLLHVVDGGPPDAARVTSARRTLEHLVPAAARAWCDVRFDAVAGTPAESIVGAAQRRAADLLVLGASPRTMAERVIAGSAAGGVLRRASCPVLIVPGPPDAPLHDAASPWCGYAGEPVEAGAALAPG